MQCAEIPVHLQSLCLLFYSSRPLMAKKQTFGDKMSKKAAVSHINVRVIKPYHSEKGNLKYLERFVKINDLSEIDKIDISR